MTRQERLHAIQAAIREKHRQIHALQGDTIASMHDSLDGLAVTVESTKRAADAAKFSIEAARKTLDIISKAHDTVAALYEDDNTLEDVVQEGDL